MAGYTLGDLQALSQAASVHPVPYRMWSEVYASLDTGDADYAYILAIVTSILEGWEDWFDAVGLDLDPGFSYLPNGAMETWTAGDSAAPDGFTLEGAGATIARGTSGGPPDGSEFAKVTRSGANATLSIPIPAALLAATRIGCRAWLYQPSGTSLVQLQTRFEGTDFGTTAGDLHRVLDLAEWALIENRSIIPSTYTSARIQMQVLNVDGEGWIGGIRVWPIWSVSSGQMAKGVFQTRGVDGLHEEAVRSGDAIQGVADTRSSIRVTVGGLELEADTGSVVDS